uniref:Uncharacterized protein n=1 Tax=Strigamia maritima TaxID=126957 RepID=T1JD36_STRMM
MLYFIRFSLNGLSGDTDLSLDYYMHTNKSFLGQCTTLEFPVKAKIDANNGTYMNGNVGLRGAEWMVEALRELLRGKKLNTVIVMKIIPPKLCPQSLTWFGITDKIDFAYLIPIVTGFRFDIKVSVRTYHFSSTFRNPCISDEEFMQCYKACVHRRIAKAECKLPFMDSSYQQLPCNNSDRKTAESSYLTNLNTILTPNIYSECKCLPACSQNVYGLEASIVAADNTELQVSLDQIAVTVTQRLAYDRNNLLTDIGGNLSLFMGLSLLAITDILQQVIMWLNRSHKRITMNRLENLQ